jgi:hypothetical protein
VGRVRQATRCSPQNERPNSQFLAVAGDVPAANAEIDSFISEAWDGSFAIVARTALGPIYIGGAAGDNDHRKWWFGLGRTF